MEPLAVGAGFNDQYLRHWPLTQPLENKAIFVAEFGDNQSEAFPINAFAVPTSQAVDSPQRPPGSLNRGLDLRLASSRSQSLICSVARLHLNTVYLRIVSGRRSSNQIKRACPFNKNLFSFPRPGVPVRLCQPGLVRAGDIRPHGNDAAT